MDSERAGDRERWWQIHDKQTYICPDCGRTKAEHGREWQVHHINRERGKIVGLCKPCHDIRHGADVVDIDVQAWKAAFLGKEPHNHREDHSESRLSEIGFNNQTGDT